MKAELKAKIVGYICNDWPLKLVSILLAIVIWFLICEYADPDTDTHVNNIPITVVYEGSVPQGLGLGIMTVIDDTVSVRVSGSRDTIALMNPNKITATLDFSNATNSGEDEYPVKIDVGGQNISVIDYSPQKIKVRFDKNIVADVKVNVSVSGKVGKGFILEDPVMLNNYVKISGPQAIVNTIASAEIEIKQDKFVETNTFTCDYTFVDKEGKEVPKTFLTVDVETIDVTVGVVKQKTVPFAVNIINSSGGNDSAFSVATIKPKNITITGSAEVLDEINAVNLGVIDVAEHTEDFEMSMPVVLPNGVKNVENVETAKVTVKFTDVQQQTFEVSNIELQNLPDGTTAKVQQKKLAIKVRGLPADIKALKAKDIKVIIDAKNQILPAGTHRITALIDFPDNLNVGAVGKYQMTVVVT